MNHPIDAQAPLIQEATFAGGCFWCTEAVFTQLDGVLSVEPGYSNGPAPAPTYESVCTGDTGHAEVIRLRFDPARIGFKQLLHVFFATHDPTTLNRQGNDVGTQYRSGIYTHSLEQAQDAHDVIKALDLEGGWGAPIVTEVCPVDNYHRAELYHHRYYEQHPNQGYCAWVVAPKVHKTRTLFNEWLRPDTTA